MAVEALQSPPATPMGALPVPHAAPSEDILEYGLWAIANLADECAANQARMGQHGACAGACMLGESCHIGAFAQGGYAANRARLSN